MEKEKKKKTASVAFKDRFAHHRRGQIDGIVVPTNSSPPNVM